MCIRGARIRCLEQLCASMALALDAWSSYVLRSSKAEDILETLVYICLRWCCLQLPRANFVFSSYTGQWKFYCISSSILLVVLHDEYVYTIRHFWLWIVTFFNVMYPVILEAFATLFDKNKYDRRLCLSSIVYWCNSYYEFSHRVELCKSFIALAASPLHLKLNASWPPVPSSQATSGQTDMKCWLCSC